MLEQGALHTHTYTGNEDELMKLVVGGGQKIGAKNAKRARMEGDGASGRTVVTRPGDEKIPEPMTTPRMRPAAVRTPMLLV
jgi:hypothetical protein